MGIQISGVNGVDKIVATDGTIDVFSGTSISGVLTATSFTGNLTGDVTGNLTGNVNASSNLLLQIGGSEKFRVGSSGQLGIGGANYGTSGQVLQSAGSGAPPTWNTIASDSITEGNTKVEAVDSGTGYITAEVDGTEALRIKENGHFGLGTNSPVQDLHIRRDNAALRIETPSGTTIQASSGGAASFFGNISNHNLNFVISNSTKMKLNTDGHLIPGNDSQHDLGLTGTRWRNLYADTLYGDGSNLTGAGNLQYTANDTVYGGPDAGASLQNGALDNVFLGHNAGNAWTTGNYSIAIGSGALATATTSNEQVAVGSFALDASNGNYNIGVGNNALTNNTSGVNNTALGMTAPGGSNTTGSNNVYLGHYSGYNVTTGSNNIVIGSNSTASSATVSNEVTIGDTNITKFRIPGINVILKDNGGTPTNGHVLTVDSNGEAGFAAASSGGVTSDAQQNTVGGTNAGDSFSGTNAEKNTLFGYDAGTNISTGDNNTAFGYNSLSSCTTGYDNISLGWGSATQLVGAHNNVIVGRSAATGLTNNGHRNVVLGNFALRGGDASQNTAIGDQCLKDAATNCIRNTGVGMLAGENVTTGAANVFVGFKAGDQITTGGNNTIIGNEAAASSATVSNEITLGNTSITKFRIPGINVTLKDNGGTPTQGHVLTVDGNGEAGFAAAGGGQVLQTIQATKSDTASYSVNSGGITPNVLEVNITLSSNTSKVMIYAHACVNDYAQVFMVLTRNGSTIALGDGAGSRMRVTSGSNLWDSTSMDSVDAVFLDDPYGGSGSVSQITYSFKLRCRDNNTSTIYLNRSENDSNYSYEARGFTNIIVQEIAA